MVGRGGRSLPGPAPPGPPAATKLVLPAPCRDPRRLWHLLSVLPSSLVRPPRDCTLSVFRGPQPTQGSMPSPREGELGAPGRLSFQGKLPCGHAFRAISPGALSFPPSDPQGLPVPARHGLDTSVGCGTWDRTVWALISAPAVDLGQIAWTN